MNFKSDLDINKQETYIVSLFNTVMTVKWFNFIKKTQLISSTGDPKIT